MASSLTEQVDALHRRIQTALGMYPADLVLANCRVVNVYSEEIHPADIAIVDEQIVAVRESYDGEAKTIVDCDGMYALPGLIQPLSVRPAHNGSKERALNAVIHGTTAVVEDTDGGPKGRAQANGRKAPWRVVEMPSRAPQLCENPLFDNGISAPLRAGRTLAISAEQEEYVLSELLDEIVAHDVDTRHLCLADPIGRVDKALLAAVQAGVPPLRALQMASLNAATHYGVDHEIGSVAPGRWADILVQPDLEHFPPKAVYVGGRLVASAGSSM